MTRPMGENPVKAAMDGAEPVANPSSEDEGGNLSQSGRFLREFLYSDDLAEAVVGNEILPQLVYSLSEQNRFYKKAASSWLPDYQRISRRT